MIRMRWSVAILSATAAIMAVAASTAIAAASGTGDVVYTSLVLGLTKGVTDIYSIGSGGATLLGRLDKGGGGPVAVDAQQNVYVIEANYDSSFFQQNTPVNVYAPGSTTPFRKFVAHGFGAQAMTIGPDGTVYMAGPLYPNTSTFRVLKFAPGATKPTYLPIDRHAPIYPLGIAVDAAGDVFVGWSSGGTCQIANFVGCVDELAVGDDVWRTRLSPASAVNDYEGGPAIALDGSLVLHTASFDFNYLSTVPSDGIAPSSVVGLPSSVLAGQSQLAFDGSGSVLYGIVTGLGSDNTVYGLNYPSGSVGVSFTVTAPHGAPFFVTGLAASPANIPSVFRHRR